MTGFEIVGERRLLGEDVAATTMISNPAPNRLNLDRGVGKLQRDQTKLVRILIHPDERHVAHHPTKIAAMVLPCDENLPTETGANDQQL